eukprot:4273672-Prymnesium_polylepis.1
MHASPRLGQLLGHGRHHEFDGTGDSKLESSFRTTHHGLIDGTLQVTETLRMPPRADSPRPRAPPARGYRERGYTRPPRPV